MQMIEALAIIAIASLFWFATLAQGQYGNPNDPYLNYQRIEREREALDLQRRQVEALERAEWDQQVYRTMVESQSLYGAEELAQ